MGLLIASQLSRHLLEFTPVNERVTSLRLRVRDRTLTVDLAYGPNSSAEYPDFLVSLRGVLESALTGDSIVLLGGLQRPRGQQQCYLEGCDWEEWPPQSEPEWCFVTGLLC